MKNKIISSGIIIWKIEDNKVKFFVCTPGGPLWNNRTCWNFPKGEMEENEKPFETAYREFTEETGTTPGSTEESDYIYHGLVRQRSDKSVHVFSKEWSGEKLDNTCYSNTFLWKDGKYYPEIGEYKWMTYNEIYGNGVKVYYPIFKEIEEEVISKNI